MVYLPADDYENYREDFYLSALTGTDGLTAVNLRPETVYVADGVTLIPVSAGRTAVSFTNALGYSLRRLTDGEHNRTFPLHRKILIDCQFHQNQ